MGQILYLRDTAGSGVTLLAGVLGTWSAGSDSGHVGGNARSMSLTAGSSQVDVSDIVAVSGGFCHAQFVSAPLIAQLSRP